MSGFVSHPSHTFLMGDERPLRGGVLWEGCSSVGPWGLSWGKGGVNIGVTYHHASPREPPGLPITESAPCYMYVPRVMQTPGEVPALPVRMQPGCRSTGAKPSTLCTDNDLQTMVINNYLLLDLLVAAFPQPE